MRQTEYKVVRFIDPQFPIYVSVQSDREVLVKIHHHTSAELMQVLEGRVQLLIGNVYRECQKGDIIFIPPSAVHEVLSLTENAAIRGITYELSLIDIPDLQLDLAALFHRRQRLLYVVSPQTESHAELHAAISGIFALYGDFSIGSKIQIVSLLLSVKARLIRLFALEESVMDKHHLKLRPVLSYLENHYPEKIQIAQLSGLIHVCDDRLIRLFKEVTGETPIAYLVNLRLEASIKLLSSTDDPIAAIAEKTGFGSDTYMTRVFKQKLNTTPGKYRRR